MIKWMREEKHQLHIRPSKKPEVPTTKPQEAEEKEEKEEDHEPQTTCED